MSSPLNAQERFWQGEFGSQYTARNRVEWKSRRSFWDLILEKTSARSVLEVGCNAGWNLLALRDVDPTLKLRGVDLNDEAIEQAKAEVFDVRKVAGRDVGNMWPRHFDLVFTAGVLIHVGPEYLMPTMRSIIRASSKWVLAVEYAAAFEEEVEYRGHAERLWKRPFGQMYQDLGLEVVYADQLLKGEGFDDCHAWLCRKGDA